MLLEPRSQVLQRLAHEPFAVDRGKLTHERQDRGIRQSRLASAELACRGQPAVQFTQEFYPTVTVEPWIGVITIGVLVTVQIMFERSIIARDQVDIVALKPTMRVPLLQPPLHDPQALINHGAISEH